MSKNDAWFYSVLSIVAFSTLLLIVWAILMDRKNDPNMYRVQFGQHSYCAESVSVDTQTGVRTIYVSTAPIVISK